MPGVDFWEQRYAGDGFAYGEAANGFLVGLAERLPRAGAALDIGAGEGRNAVFLASLGLDVLALDQSRAGLAKAERLAAGRGVKLRTACADLASYDLERDRYAVASSIFCHLPSRLRGRVLRGVAEALAPGGVLALEAYAPEQLERGTGGPKDPDMLASADQLASELEGLEFLIAETRVRDVSEGRFHTGEACVVQVLARKP